ncbi:WhiB family transcriptional regulator [Streptomyces sp. NBC_01233]|uniref:WhiB family transcriptional regulator n=1 Tax=Streptomyces sp. NBC_01233 TaxID=2903787 RepID=UPI002E13C81C|nr:WhiB family transcriptional regulator [Streptomyces sp. NBC_01233]
MPRPGRYWPDTRHNSTPRPAHWDRNAACRHEDPALFFPEGEETEVLEQTAAAKEICRSCPVVHPCLVDALDRDERFGVWGGLDEDDRLRLLSREAETEAGDEETADGRAPATAAA